MRVGGRRTRSNVIRGDMNQRALVLLSASVRFVCEYWYIASLGWVGEGGLKKMKKENESMTCYHHDKKWKNR